MYWQGGLSSGSDNTFRLIERGRGGKNKVPISLRSEGTAESVTHQLNSRLLESKRDEAVIRGVVDSVNPHQEA